MEGPGNTHSFTHRYLLPVPGTGGTRSDKPLPACTSHSMGRRQTRKDPDVMSGTHKCHEGNRAGKGQKVKTGTIEEGGQSKCLPRTPLSVSRGLRAGRG